MNTKEISTQLLPVVKDNLFTPPVWHTIKENQNEHDFCQFLANATGLKVRMTYAPNGSNTEVHNGHYYHPKF